MANNKQRGNRLKSSLRKEMIQLFRNEQKTRLGYKEVSGIFKMKGSEKRKLVHDILKELVHDGILNTPERGFYIWNGAEKGVSADLEGTIEVTQRGAGFVIVDGLDKDIYIAKPNIGQAFHGDKVGVRILKKSAKRTEGQVVKVLERKKTHFVGVIEKNEKFAFLVPDDHRMDVDLFIPLSKLNGAHHGYKAVVELTDWPADSKSPFAKVTEVLGKPGSNDAEMFSILSESGIGWTFPEEVIQESSELDQTISEDEIANRRDFRKVTTFTIDPHDAKDFDDALSIEFLENGNAEIGIHIADVGHYVTVGSELDKEARKRGNSTYLVDRVIPMLPETISNVLCSLRPHEEKYCFSAVFEINPQGKIEKEWFGKGVIYSDRRFTYEEAQEIIEGKEGDLKHEILFMDKLAKKYRSERMKSGALNIVSEEVRFKLDEQGLPIEVVKKVAKDSNQLVEEFMLLANKKVAEYIGITKKEFDIPLVYRVHDRPDMEKLATFNVFLQKFNLKGDFSNPSKVAGELNKLFDQTREENEFGMIQQMAIRSMSKAAYDISNIGHYGLGFSHYAHFTSPIRRYADLLVHRAVFDELNGVKPKHGNDLRETCKHISKTERQSIDAERNSTKYFQVIFVRDSIGEEFEGTITGLTEWGMYVEMNDNKCEGMVSLKEISGDTYVFDNEKYVVKGINYGDEYNMGDSVKVVLRKVNVRKRQIDLDLVS